jgi:hypothetical protein
LTRKNTTEIKATLSSLQANKIKISDEIVLKTVDNSSGGKKEFLVKVLKVISDIPRCNGCTIRLDNKQSYKYKTGYYCWDCFKKRKETNGKVSTRQTTRSNRA